MRATIWSRSFHDSSSLPNNALFKVSQRQASRYCQQWGEQEFLVVSDAAKKSRRYRLSSEYESLFS